ncbi:sulfotransferase 6B1-like [Physella acuta]|uniref:sulfotransferase 6B1-like n=1 Tax=Physella acuta TaxID=109671 RepID=UPI0027DABD49|nr:sulfotransferase 6B1-like [Physella acuta]
MNEDLLKLLSRDTYGFPSNTSVYDVDGRELRLLSLDEKLVAPFGENSYRKVRDVTLRDDDVMLIGYPKTGCHWAWEILSMMVKKCAVPSKFGKVTAFLEASPMNLLENTPSPRVLNSHLWWDYLPRQLTEKKTKIVLTYRNPKDTAVSYYHHIVSLFDLYKYDGTFKSWFPLYMEGQIDYESYFDYYLEWDHVIKSHPDHPILVVSYEDMKQDLPTVMKRMSAFLDLDLDDQLLAEIAKAAGSDAMKTTYNQSQSLSKALMRKGQVGDWKNCLTVAQSEAVDKAMKNLEGTLFSEQNQKYTL